MEVLYIVLILKDKKIYMYWSIIGEIKDIITQFKMKSHLLQILCDRNQIGLNIWNGAFEQIFF